MDTRKRVRQMFRDLRKEGFYAKMDYWCCRSCAWSDIGQREKENGIELENVVFFSKQNDIDSGEVWLSWSGDAKKIFKAAENNGLYMIWNGESDRSIHLIDADLVLNHV